MKAFQFVAWQKPPQLVDVPVREPGPGQVLVKIAASGACHSDLHVMEWPEGQLPWKLPFTLGHEPAGFVEQVGAGVTGLARGDGVLVYGPWGCGRCVPCRGSAEQYCDRQGELGGSGVGLGFDGGMAEYLLVPSARFLVPLGDLDPVQAAPLTDAALTPYSALKPHLGRLGPGSAALVIGAGGLGHMAIQLLRALTPAEVIAVDASSDKLALAREVGATHAVPAGDDAVARIRSITPRHGVDLVLDCVGAEPTLKLAAAALRPCGHLSVIGLAMGTLPFSFFAVPYGASVGTSYWGSIAELMEVVSLARAGDLKVHVETFPLARVAEAYDRLKKGTLSGRAVVVP
ncbi:MAG TPA: NAD(P)-dependent alcohol dehydrogenase [Myxococcales bacterium]|nr:NAD(P)-dependent alcohol dehydrogenase [Myxococcales bacterium]